MDHEPRNREQTDMIEEQADSGHHMDGAPAGARQNVRIATEQGAVARPGGATQNSGGAIAGNDEECGTGPGRGAD